MIYERLSRIDQCEYLRLKFLGRLNEAQEWLRQHNIPFRIIGSLALHTYTGLPINYVRKNRVGYQRVPDVDLIVPRANLSEVEAYRKTLLNQDFPVDLSLPSAQIHIDFRPGEEYSYLTHKNLKLPMKTDLWQPVTRYIDTTPIVTIPPRTLFHTFVVCGGILRDKDWGEIMALGRYIRSEVNEFTQTETDYATVHEFIRRRRKQYPWDSRMMWLAETQVPKLPSFLYFQICDKLNPVIDLYFRMGERLVK